MKKFALSLLVMAASGAYVWNQSGKATTDDILGPSPQFSDAKTDKLSLSIEATAVNPTYGGGAASLLFGARQLPGTIDAATRKSLLPSDVPTERLSDANRATENAQVLAPPIAFVAPPVTVEIPIPRPRPAYQTPGAGKIVRREPLARDLVIRAAMDVAATQARYADGKYTGPVTDAYYGPIQIQAIVQGGRLVDIRVLQYPAHRRTSVAINRQALPMLRDEVVSAQSAEVDIISGATLTSEAFIRSLSRALRSARA